MKTIFCKKLLLSLLMCLITGTTINSFGMKRKRDIYGENSEEEEKRPKKRRRETNNYINTESEEIEKEKLLCAIQNGDYESVKRILDFSPNLLNEKIEISHGHLYRPLDIAMSAYKKNRNKKTNPNYYKIIKILLQKGVGLNFEDSRSKTFIYHLANLTNEKIKKLVNFISYESKIENKKELLKKILYRLCKKSEKLAKFLIDKHEIQYESDIIFYAINKCSIKFLEQYLEKENKLNVNAIDKNGNTPLHLLIQNSKEQHRKTFPLKKIIFLLKNGADISNFIPQKQWLHIELLKILVNNGADISKKNIENKSLLEIALENLIADYFYNLKYSNTINLSIKYLIDNGANINFPNLQKCLENIIIKLYDIIKHNQQFSAKYRSALEILNLLIKNGAEIKKNQNRFFDLSDLSKYEDEKESRPIMITLKGITNSFVAKENITTKLKYLSEILWKQLFNKNPEENILSISELIKQDIDTILNQTIKFEDTIYNIDYKNIKQTANKIKDLIINNKKLSPFDKLLSLSYIASLKYVITKGQSAGHWNYIISESDIEKCFKHIPFNYYFFHNKNCKNLRTRVFKTHNIKDINGKTIETAICNYPKYMPVLFANNYFNFFDPSNTQGPEPKDLLENILFSRDKLSSKKAYVKKLLNNIVPITTENITTNPDKSYKNNKFHKKFVNSCTLFTILNGQMKNKKTLPKEVVAKIIGYTDGKLTKTTSFDTFDIQEDPITKEEKTVIIKDYVIEEDDVSYLPSKELMPIIKNAVKYKEKYQERVSKGKKKKTKKKK